MFDVCHHVMDAREKLGDAHAGSWEMHTREAGRCARGKLGDVRAGSWEMHAGSWEMHAREAGRALREKDVVVSIRVEALAVKLWHAAGAVCWLYVDCMLIVSWLYVDSLMSDCLYGRRNCMDVCPDGTFFILNFTRDNLQSQHNIVLAKRDGVFRW